MSFEQIPSRPSSPEQTPEEQAGALYERFARLRQEVDPGYVEKEKRLREFRDEQEGILEEIYELETRIRKLKLAHDAVKDFFMEHSDEDDEGTLQFAGLTGKQIQELETISQESFQLAMPLEAELRELKDELREVNEEIKNSSYWGADGFDEKGRYL